MQGVSEILNEGSRKVESRKSVTRSQDSRNFLDFFSNFIWTLFFKLQKYQVYSKRLVKKSLFLSPLVTVPRDRC